MSVEVVNLTKIFGKQKAVDNINFSADKGEIVGFLGPNGAGKSTTMKVATGYIPPTQGTIKVCGFDVRHQSLEVKKHIGYLPEHNPLYLDMYVHEFLNFTGSLHIRHSKQRKSRIEEMIAICGLEREQNKKIGELSKGYRQRVGLAQALLHDPDVLILDEPTTGLDPNQIIEIRNLIRSVSANKTVIFSTHIMQEVQAICDKVVIINKGSIVANAATDELKKVKNNTRITAQFKEKIAVASLKEIPGVVEVNELEQNKFVIVANADEDIRPHIFQFSTRNGLTLIQLNAEENNMEDIFRQLTAN